MFKGTTPTFYFRINDIDDLSTISDIWVTIKKSDRESITKTLAKEEVELDDENRMVTLKLTQEETLSFGAKIKIQLKILTNDENVCISPIFGVQMDNILNTEIMKLPSTDEEEGESDETE